MLHHKHETQNLQPLVSISFYIFIFLCLWIPRSICRLSLHSFIFVSPQIPRSVFLDLQIPGSPGCYIYSQVYRFLGFYGSVSLYFQICKFIRLNGSRFQYVSLYFKVCRSLDLCIFIFLYSQVCRSLYFYMSRCQDLYTTLFLYFYVFLSSLHFYIFPVQIHVEDVNPNSSSFCLKKTEVA